MRVPGVDALDQRRGGDARVAAGRHENCLSSNHQAEAVLAHQGVGAIQFRAAKTVDASIQ